MSISVPYLGHGVGLRPQHYPAILDDPVVGEYSVSDMRGIRSAPYDAYPRTYASVTGAEVHDEIVVSDGTSALRFSAEDPDATNPLVLRALLEAGMPVVSKSDEAAIREIVRRLEGSNTQVFSFARCMVDDVKRSVDTGVKGIVMEVPSSTHIIDRAYRWTLAKAIETSVEATRFARDNGLYVVFFPIDFSRAPLDWVLNLLKKVATEGHMDALAIVDTFGGLAPHTVPTLVGRMRQVFPATPFEVHFHDDFGMAVANTLLALAAGCQVAHTSVTGIGERAGNCAYEELALALKTMYDVDLGLKTERFVEISRLVQQLAGVRVPANRCIVGDQLFDIESGIIVSWLRNCGKAFPTELAPFRPELVGNAGPRAVRS